MSGTVQPLPPSRWVVRAERLSALVDGQHILDTARQQAHSLLAATGRETALVRQRAHEAGRDSGLRETAELVATAQAALAAQREKDAAEILPLAFAIAHRILGAFDEDDRLLRAARAALDDHHGQAGLRLRVAPAIADRLRAALRAAGETSVSVEADTGLDRDECTLVHPRGRAAVGPLDQLRAIMAARPDNRS